MLQIWIGLDGSADDFPRLSAGFRVHPELQTLFNLNYDRSGEFKVLIQAMSIFENCKMRVNHVIYDHIGYMTYMYIHTDVYVSIFVHTGYITYDAHMIYIYIYINRT